MIKTDLDKLIYTMETLHKVKNKRQFPEFWNEKWLKEAIEEVDRSAMSAEKRLAYEMLIARNAAVVYGEKRKIEEVKLKAIKKALIRGKLTLEEIAEDHDVSIDFVQKVQQQLEEK